MDKIQKIIEDLELQKIEIEKKLFFYTFVERALNGEDENKVIGEASQYGFHPVDMATAIDKLKKGD